MTNYEFIKSLTVEEMAETICDMIECSECWAKDLCVYKDGRANGLVKWLGMEVEDDA